jgi:ubiquinone/menaquinone biosynthesis C-methylase UbiE
MIVHNPNQRRAARHVLMDKSNTPRMFSPSRAATIFSPRPQLNIDRRWRRELIRACEVARARAGVSTCATGTGDIAIELVRRSPAVELRRWTRRARRMLEVARGGN